MWPEIEPIVIDGKMYKGIWRETVNIKGHLSIETYSRTFLRYVPMWSLSNWNCQILRKTGVKLTIYYHQMKLPLLGLVTSGLVADQSGTMGIWNNAGCCQDYMFDSKTAFLSTTHWRWRSVSNAYMDPLPLLCCAFCCML